MDEIIIIEHQNSPYITKEVVKSYYDLFTAVVKKCQESNIWATSIEKIIITDNFEETVYREADKWNLETILSKKRHFVVTSKIIFNHNLDDPKHKLIFSLLDIMSPNYPLLEMIYGQILRVTSRSLIPKSIYEKNISGDLKSLDDYVRFSSTEWVKAFYCGTIISKLDIQHKADLEQKNILSMFKSDLKKALFDYNTDKGDNSIRLDNFWNTYHNSLHKLILHFIESNQIPISFDEVKDEQSTEHIQNVINEIETLVNNCKKGLPYKLGPLKKRIIKLSGHFEVFLEKEKNDCFYIRLPKNPKDYFTESLVETEPRLVCFMDIRGFSEKIKEYENNVTSTLLQDIQEAFALAKEQLLNQTGNQDSIKNLKYQTFSDNICISIPYFDNEEDFLANLNLLAVYVRGLSLIMMTKKLFMRGGLSIGPFYSDENIIFSSALVKSYNLESKVAIYPRVVIDDEIIQKISNYKLETVTKYFLNKSIIFDWEDTAFLFPFDLIEGSQQTLNNAFDAIKVDNSSTDQFDSIINNLMDSVQKFTNNLLEGAKKEEQKGKEGIRNTIVEQILENQNNKRVMNKFVWLLELLNWSENKETRLHFDYLENRFNPEKPTDNT